jgi:hypothetical protein
MSPSDRRDTAFAALLLTSLASLQRTDRRWSGRAHPNMEADTMLRQGSMLFLGFAANDRCPKFWRLVTQPYLARELIADWRFYALL